MLPDVAIPLALSILYTAVQYFVAATLLGPAEQELVVVQVAGAVV